MLPCANIALMTRRVITVLLLCVLSISLWAPDLRRAFAHPVGIMASGAAGGAAVNPRDISLQASDIPTRLRFARNGDCWTLAPNTVCRYGVREAGGVRVFAVRSHAEPASDGRDVLYRDALALLFLFVGAAMLLMRPSAATWAFFILSLYGWSPNNVYTMLGPPWLQVLTTAFENVWEACVPFAGVIFALYLLQPYPLPQWRRKTLAATYTFIALCATAEIAATFLIAYGGINALVPYLNPSFIWIGILGTVLPPFVLLATYLESAPSTRERIRWVLAGFTIAALASASTLITGNLSYAAYSASQGIYVLAVTATTAYAVLRHRIIDVNVVVSRAVVYTALSAIVVGLFALVDLFFSRTLSESKAGLMADVALALVLGFFMNSLHHGVDRVVDGVLFRNRHMAEKHLATVAAALNHAVTAERVNQMLIDEPVYSFVLRFGVLARCTPEGGLETVHGAGAPTVLGLRLPDADALVAYVLAERKPLRLREHRWRAETLAVDGIEPSVAVPIFSHAELVAVALFSPHKNHTEIDGDELALIESVAVAAGAAYDRLEAKALRDEVLQLRSSRTHTAPVGMT